MTKNVTPKLFLFGAFGHLLCWLGGDLLLYFMPSGPLNVMGLFDYQTTVTMLEGASALQFTLSGVFGVIAMMVIMPGYFQIANFLKPIDHDHTGYTDEVEIHAGWKTPFVCLWAKLFYAHRQRKWIRLLHEHK